MNAPSVQQAQALANFFDDALTLCRPGEVAILGVAGGNGLDRIDRTCTRRIVAVDINQQYLDTARQRYANLPGLELHNIDLSATAISLSAVDLVFAALIFEHAGIELCLENAVRLVAPNGFLAVVLQLPSKVVDAVSSTGIASMEQLKSTFRLIEPSLLVARLMRYGFTLAEERSRAALRKAFWMGLFKRSQVSLPAHLAHP